MNPILNAVLSFYQDLFLQADCMITYAIQYSAKLPLDAIELGVVLSNILENALHACKAIKQHNKKYTLTFSMKNNKLMIEVSNPIQRTIAFNEEGLPINQEEHHGIDSQSIASFVKQHPGILDYDIQNEMFVVRLYIDDFTNNQ